MPTCEYYIYQKIGKTWEFIHSELTLDHARSFIKSLKEKFPKITTKIDIKYFI